MSLTKKELIVELEALRRKTAEQEATIAALRTQLHNVTDVASAVNSMQRGADPVWLAQVNKRKAEMEAAKVAAMTLRVVVKA